MIYALEGLRGIAAIIVSLYHGWSSVATSIKIVRNGWLFVDLFFVISGFVMSHVYRDKLHTKTDVSSFVIRRFGRLYPLHFVMIFVVIIFSFLWGTSKDIALLFGHKIGPNPAYFPHIHLSAIIANLFMVHGIGVGPIELNIPSWSISAEIWTYFAFAATVFYSNRAPGRRIFLWLFLSILGIIACFFSGKPDLNIVFSGFSWFRCIYGFFLGASLPLLKKQIKPNFVQISTFQVLAFLISIGLVLCAGAYPWTTFITPIAFAGLVLAVSYDFGIIAKALQIRPIQTLGKLSYSIYMTHWSLLLIFSHLVKPLDEPYKSLLRVVYVAAVLGVSMITYRWIEVPWRSRFHRYADRIGRSKKIAEESGNGLISRTDASVTQFPPTT